MRVLARQGRLIKSFIAHTLNFSVDPCMSPAGNSYVSKKLTVPSGCWPCFFQNTSLTMSMICRVLPQRFQVWPPPLLLPGQAFKSFCPADPLHNVISFAQNAQKRDLRTANNHLPARYADVTKNEPSTPSRMRREIHQIVIDRLTLQQRCGQGLGSELWCWDLTASAS